jgi:phage baseplate assembly protein V
VMGLGDLGNRVMMMIARGVLRGVTDSSSRQTLQVELLKGEIRDGIERMQNYGFTSHPTGGDVAVMFLGGNREQGIVVAVDDRRYRLTTLQAGEVAIYDDLGNKVELLRDMVKVTAVQHLQAEAPTTEIVSAVTITGSLTVNGSTNITGSLTNNGKAVGSTHRHAGGQTPD